MVHVKGTYKVVVAAALDPPPPEKEIVWAAAYPVPPPPNVKLAIEVGVRTAVTVAPRNKYKK